MPLLVSPPRFPPTFTVSTFASLRHRAAADPTADVEGFDVQAKIALLTKLAFGATVSSDSVRREACDEIQSEGRGVGN